MTLVNNSELRFEYASNARKLAECAFEINDVIAKHLAIYEQV